MLPGVTSVRQLYDQLKTAGYIQLAFKVRMDEKESASEFNAALRSIDRSHYKDAAQPIHEKCIMPSIQTLYQI